MLNQLIRFHKKDIVDFVLKLMLAVLVTCLIGPIAIELEGETTITLQTLVILLFAISFGWRVGGLSVLIYIALGAAGMPVFAKYASGYHVLLSLNGGFFYGFVFAAFTCGFLAELPPFQKQLAGVMNWMLGHIIILVFGFAFITQLDTEWKEKLSLLWPGALIKSVAGALIIHLVFRFLSRKNNRQQAFEY